MIVTIGGMPGSGKDIVGKELACRLGYRFYSTGDMLGEMAHERGITINQLMEQARGEESIDRDLDQRTRELGEKEDNLVVSSHLAAHFIPKAFRVFLSVTPEEGARRVYQDSGNRKDEHYSSLGECREALEKLVKNNRERFLKLYRFDPYEGKGYDLVINTTRIPANEVVERILEGIGKPE